MKSYYPACFFLPLKWEGGGGVAMAAGGGGESRCAGVKWCHSSARSLRSGAGGRIFICHGDTSSKTRSKIGHTQCHKHKQAFTSHTLITSVDSKGMLLHLCWNKKKHPLNSKESVKLQVCSLHFWFLLCRKRVYSLTCFIYRFCYFQTFDQCEI